MLPAAEARSGLPIGVQTFRAPGSPLGKPFERNREQPLLQIQPNIQIKEQGIDGFKFSLPDIPLPHIREAIFAKASSLFRTVIEHEDGHALVAWLKGHNILRMDFKPSSDGSIARVFMSSMDPEVAAAGSAAAGEFGVSSDRNRVESMGLSWRDQVAAAGGRLFQIKDIKKKFDSIVAYIVKHLGPVIPGSMVPLIYQRAQEEIVYEKELKSKNKKLSDINWSFSNEFENREQWISEVTASEVLPPNYTKRSYFRDGTTIDEVYEDGEVTETIKKCGVCGGVNTHIKWIHDVKDKWNNIIPKVFQTPLIPIDLGNRYGVLANGPLTALS